MIFSVQVNLSESTLQREQAPSSAEKVLHLQPASKEREASLE